MAEVKKAYQVCCDCLFKINHTQIGDSYLAVEDSECDYHN